MFREDPTFHSLNTHTDSLSPQIFSPLPDRNAQPASAHYRLSVLNSQTLCAQRDYCCSQAAAAVESIRVYYIISSLQMLYYYLIAVRISLCTPTNHRALTRPRALPTPITDYYTPTCTSPTNHRALYAHVHSFHQSQSINTPTCTSSSNQ